MRTAIVLALVTVVAAVSAHNFTIHSHSHSHGNSSSKSDEILEVSRNVTVIEFSRTIIEQATVDTDLIEMALNSSLGDIGDKPTLFCQVAQLKNVYYYYGVIGNQYNYGITSLGSCLYHCVVNNHERRAHQGDDGDENDCKAVNYFSYHKACQLLNSGIESLETADRRTYGQMNGVVHAYIQSCYGPDGETTSAPKRTTRPPWHTIPPVAPATNGCGVSAYQPSVSDKQRIIRGQEAKAHSWPWVVLFNLNFGQQRSFCGGTLLRIREDVEESDVVLTAAHCVTRPETQASNPIPHDASVMTIVAGDHRRYVQEMGEVHRRVSIVRFHSGFRFTPHTGAVNDIALLKLQSPIRFNDVIRPICLPEQNAPIPSTSLCVAAGWGRNDSRHMYVMPDALQQLVVPVQDADTCRAGWGHVYSERDMICAGTLTGTASTCQGDSGGMLACKSSGGRWVQYGVTSFGVGGSCLEPYKPSVFARVSSYVDWIRKNAYSISTLTSEGRVDTDTDHIDSETTTVPPEAI